LFRVALIFLGVGLESRVDLWWGLLGFEKQKKGKNREAQKRRSREAKKQKSREVKK
jgi:hypothetical protein